MYWQMFHPALHLLRQIAGSWRVSKQRVGIVLCAVSLLSLLWIASAPAQAQSGGWSEVYRLSSDAGTASEASLATDPYGFVHSFWTETLFADGRRIIQYA